MGAELIIAPEAEQDVLQAYYWYEDRWRGLGEEFLDCVDVCIQGICRILYGSGGTLLTRDKHFEAVEQIETVFVE